MSQESAADQSPEMLAMHVVGGEDGENLAADLDRLLSTEQT